MKTKNLVILSVWLAFTFIFALLMWLGVAYTTTTSPTQWLLWMTQDVQIFFVIALIFTGAFAFLLKDKGESETMLLSELRGIRLKLDALFKEVKEVKKTIEE